MRAMDEQHAVGQRQTEWLVELAAQATRDEAAWEQWRHGEQQDAAAKATVRAAFAARMQSLRAWKQSVQNITQQALQDVQQWAKQQAAQDTRQAGSRSKVSRCLRRPARPPRRGQRRVGKAGRRRRQQEAGGERCGGARVRCGEGRRAARARRRRGKAAAEGSSWEGFATRTLALAGQYRGVPPEGRSAATAGWRRGGATAEGLSWRGFVTRTLTLAGRYRGVPPE